MPLSKCYYTARNINHEEYWEVLAHRTHVLLPFVDFWLSVCRGLHHSVGHPYGCVDFDSESIRFD